MFDDGPGRPPARSRRARLLIRGAGIAAALAAIVTLGAVTLFTGSTVDCSELGEADAPRLRCEFEVGAAPGTVWEAFTRTEEPRPHYFDAVLQAQLKPAGRWRFVTADRQRLLAGGEILVLEPPRLFAQTFAAADLDDPPSRITIRLDPRPDGTRVVLTHDGFAHRTRTYRRFRRAHPLALSALKSLLETGRLPLRARIYTAVFRPGMKLATVRAEPWR